MAIHPMQISHLQVKKLPRTSIREEVSAVLFGMT
ncbi:hypothetical protein BBR47_05930 [Brevibacillus brevis NBRC 100599]|uniref:Uncharacterized protein n=1 Tax=Brevibacillus brevis (strain 47 / JCM 6285 / NBRC 100599) TaxID=358681 RepID=C0ZKB9_BREBN|nr:hypothetical protein BBR47_05930 [Brevibacillus brevis NBRC 100599]